mgnify:CR=1 FL=1
MEDLAEKEFDVVLVGTDCIQAVLAAALAKAGKSVLHIDENDYYGGDMVTHCFEPLLEWAEKNKTDAPEDTVVQTWDPTVVREPVDGHENLQCVAATTKGQKTFSVSNVSCSKVDETLTAPFAIAVGDRVVVMAPDPVTGRPKPPTPVHRGWGRPPPPPARQEFCRGVVKSIDESGKAEVKLDWSLANGEPPTLFAQVQQLVHAKDLDESLLSQEEKAMRAFKSIVDQSRKFNVDVKPRLLLSRGTAIEALIRSGVAHYMEFKLLEGTYVTAAPNTRNDRGKRQAKPKGGGTGEAAAAKASRDADADTSATKPQAAGATNLCIAEVPCSKADVFKNKTLVLKDKLVLMKFLQFCLDFHVEDYERVTLQDQNEALPLGAGRSLKRPQNKRKANYDFAGYADRPFIIFLRECVGLSEDLVTIAFHAIALASCDEIAESKEEVAAALTSRAPTITTRQGMQMISLYLGSLGRYGAGAYLCPLYGASEVCSCHDRSVRITVRGMCRIEL